MEEKETAPLLRITSISNARRKRSALKKCGGSVGLRLRWSRARCRLRTQGCRRWPRLPKQKLRARRPFTCTSAEASGECTLRVLVFLLVFFASRHSVARRLLPAHTTEAHIDTHMAFAERRAMNIFEYRSGRDLARAVFQSGRAGGAVVTREGHSRKDPLGKHDVARRHASAGRCRMWRTQSAFERCRNARRVTASE